MIFQSKNLYFKNIPQGYKDREKVYYIGVEFSSIQNYIFGNLDVKVTPTEMGKKSEYINELTNKIELEFANKFSRCEYDNISKASGKFFSILKKRVTVNELSKYSNEIQINVFQSTLGKLELYYGIQEAKIRTTNKKTIRKSAHTELVQKIEYNKFRCVNLLLNDASNSEKYEIDDILILSSDNKKNNIEKLDSSFSVIKFDLDNLGNFLKNIVKRDSLQQISEVLNKVLGLSVYDTPNAISVFTGGDDIFILCPTECMFLCASSVQKKLKEYIQNEEKLSEYTTNFSVSAGIQVVNNNLPIFIYSEKVEEQLDLSKHRHKNRISVEDISLTWPEFDMLSILIEKSRKDLMERWPDEYISFYNDIANLLMRIEQISEKDQFKLNAFKQLFERI